MAEAIRAIGMTEQTCYRWRAEYGGLKLDQVRRLKLLEQGSGRLRRAISDLTLEKLILKEAVSGNLTTKRRWTLTQALVALATQYGRYGYRRITALLHAEGWVCNHKRVEQIWRTEGLKAPVRQPKRGRLWLNDGLCMRLRPERPNYV